VEIPVVAEWPLSDIPLREIAALRVGDVIELPLGVLEQTRVLLNGAPKFIGTVGLEGDQVAVKVHGKIAPTPPQS
jgi:flagellar motor switch protein FliM